MLDTTRPAAQDRLRALLERLARLDWSISPAFPQAIQAFLTAMEYEDPALLRSHMNTALEAFRDLVQDTIAQRLGRPQLIRESWRTIRETLKGFPVESPDELGRELEALLGEQIASLTSLRDGPVQILQAGGYQVANAPQLQRDIEELQQLKQGIFETWPWSSQGLPPVDRQMVAASRAAIARQEGERIEDVMRRLGGDPTRGS